MDRFQCAYRDQKSPLTPLTPLASNAAFNFNFGGDNSLKTSIDSAKRKLTPTLQGRPKHLSEEFLRVREVFEVRTQKTCEVEITITTSSSTTHYERTPKQGKLQDSAQKRRLPFGQHQPLAASTRYVDFNRAGRQQQLATLKQEQLAAQKQQQMTALKQQQLAAQHHQQQQQHMTAQQQQQLAAQQQNLTVQQRQCYMKSSPIQLRPLSPRTSMLLSKMGQQQHKRLFQREEIDLCVFRQLNEHDLIKLGICCAEDRSDIMHAVRLAQNFR